MDYFAKLLEKLQKNMKILRKFAFSFWKLEKMGKN